MFGNLEHKFLATSKYLDKKKKYYNLSLRVKTKEYFIYFYIVKCSSCLRDKSPKEFVELNKYGNLSKPMKF